MLKNLALGLLNKAFGLKLTPSDLDTLLGFLDLLIGVLGTKSDAVSYMARLDAKTRTKRVKARTSFQELEKKLGDL